MRRLALPALGLMLLIASGWWFLAHRAAQRAGAATAPPAGAVTTPPLERYPLAASDQAESAALPAIDDSDGALTQSLATLAGSPVDALLNTPRLLRKFVATVDNLPRSRLAVELRPLRSIAPEVRVRGDDRAAVLDVSNFGRYEPLLALIRHIDTAAASGAYRRYYPLMQRAYQDLGYPDGHFNDRLVEVIDLLLATPEPKEPLRLVRTKVFWEFADPALEQLPAGQKLLLRMGPENTRYLKQRLQEFRTQITGARR